MKSERSWGRLGMRFENTTLGQLSIKGKGSYGIAASAVPYSDELFTYLRISDINDDGTINKSGLMSVSEEKAEQYLLKPNDIVFARTGGSTGRNYFYDGSDGEFVFAGFLIRFSIDDKKVNPLFIKYYCQSQIYKDWVHSFNTGSTRGNINAQTYANMPIILPPREQQDLLVNTLSVIDAKIAVNKAINENLEQQAQALYRQMFVNADDNQSATIADISLNVTDGVHNTVKDDPDGNYLLLSCKNIKGGSLSIGSSERHINKETFDKLRKRTQLAKGDILISSVGTIGETLMLNTEPTNYEFQRSVAMIKPDTKIVSSAYVYESLLYKKAELINAAHGAVQQCLFISDICEFPIDIPSKVKLVMFNSAVIPMFDIITAKHEENQRLSALRDTLLPKLMNGEIDVSQVQI